jgi:hypothetical protein
MANGKKPAVKARRPKLYVDKEARYDQPDLSDADWQAYLDHINRLVPQDTYDEQMRRQYGW